MKGIISKVAKSWKEASLWTRAATILLVMAIIALTISVPLFCAAIAEKEAKIDSLRVQGSCSAQQQIITGLQSQLSQCNGSATCDCSASCTSQNQLISSLQIENTGLRGQLNASQICNCTTETSLCWDENWTYAKKNQYLENRLRSFNQSWDYSTVNYSH
jgi:hypothetical protein